MPCSANTQKAIGVISGIQELLNSTDSYDHFRNSRHHLIKNVSDIERYSDIGMSYLYGVYLDGERFPCFARPCPIRPRHGFVESCIVNNKAELKSLFERTIKEDSKSELLIDPYFRNITHNAVYVSTGVLSVGLGNDGATGGRRSVSFPVAGFSASENFLSRIKIDSNEAMYIEAILESGISWHMTQLRGGPKFQNESEDFVPKSIIVKEVIAPSHDMLEWEKQTAELDGDTVVYGDGFTLASHAAVHCILNNIPFITTYEPQVGQTLRTTEHDHKNIFDRENFKKGVQFAIRKNLNDDMYNELKFCLAVLHNWAQLRKSPHASMLMGLFTTTFAKLCLSLVYGERRYLNFAIDRRVEGMRNKIYVDARKNCVKYIHGLEKVFKIFYAKNWCDGFGGFPWANCTWYTMNIWKAITDIFNGKEKEIGDKEIAVLIGEVNKTINQAHNTGWWLNKIADIRVLSFAANYPGLAALQSAEVFYSALEANNENEITTKLKTVKFKDHPCARDENDKLVWAFIEYNKARYGDAKHLTRCKEAKKPFKVDVCVAREGIKVPTRYGICITAKKAEEVYRDIAGKTSRARINKLFLNPVNKKGFMLPNGNILEYKGVKAI